ncbi:MAG TPA: NAD(P)H-binding protein [Terriglobia bacterium]|nr:NAD(P)H-binding protein [Terriglobia bacterium]
MQDTRNLNVVTGAFGYTGRYITQRLLVEGEEVRTLTGHPGRINPFQDRVSVALLNFGDPAELTASLRGAATLYNTYWVRFPRRHVSHERAVENTRALVNAARGAGVRRIVHISIANPSPDSPLSYFRGKAAAERAVVESGVSYAIVRPTLLFGGDDILISNIAWLLRRFPVFAVPGSGEYRVQPVSVEDVAAIAVDAGRAEENVVLDAVGPEIYTFNDLVGLLVRAVGSRARIIHVPASLAYLCTKPLGWLVGDVVLTREEIDGLMADLLVSREAPRGRTRLSEWLRGNAGHLGARYASELDRHYGS